MDITSLFKATVKTVKTRNKAQGIETSTDILGKSSKGNKNTAFTIRVKDVISKISHLKKFLIEHRTDYVDVRHLTSEIGSMTDAERDHIDQDAEKYMRLCSEILHKLKADFSVNEKTGANDLKQHQNGVVLLIESYLKEVCKLYTEQKAIRVKRSVDLQKISRLEPLNKIAVSVPNDGEKEEKAIEKPYRRTRTFSYDRFEEDELSPEEMQLLDQENDDLYNDLNSMVDEVRKVEGKVVEISRLQQIFTEKILQQDKDMQRISETAVSTTENIKDANDQIREAMKRNSSFRVWILFFFLVLSFSLLFLDWYNP